MRFLLKAELLKISELYIINQAVCYLKNFLIKLIKVILKKKLLLYY
ncbi:hypothetical protein HMPREF0554_1378 [Pseudoleptotrichia goodfellowii F0264]|uniref:Uncharacterized protein n=1 Tax=Pseudoleptotrichia goodfellowii F0264 TaxID=596323 RepID=D0GMG2_9FUSO|nr:hypothetical protein HMPREF0554_1378 [Pseudoleptotrichia goodfellowii F0264]